MSAMKRLIEDVAALVDEGERDELEAMLEPWDDAEKVALLIEAISLNGLISGGTCPCYKSGSK
jgi:hypothetical protein